MQNSKRISVDALVQALTKRDKEHPIGSSLIKSEVQSYNLLANEKYAKL